MFDRVLSASLGKAKCFQNHICDFSKQLPCLILFFHNTLLENNIIIKNSLIRYKQQPCAASMKPNSNSHEYKIKSHGDK